LKAKGVALVAGITLERDRVVNERKSELGFIKSMTFEDEGSDEASAVVVWGIPSQQRIALRPRLGRHSGR
jgi:hypothetical protein